MRRMGEIIVLLLWFTMIFPLKCFWLLLFWNIEMVVYYNRKLERIPVDKWHQLYADQKYSIVQRFRIGEYEVICSWIGLHVTETKKDLFLVQTSAGDKIDDIDKNKFKAECSWHRNESFAMNRADDLCKEFENLTGEKTREWSFHG